MNLGESLRVFLWQGVDAPVVGVECSGCSREEQSLMEQWLCRLINEGHTDHCETVGDVRQLLTEKLRERLSDPHAFKEEV